MFRTAWSVVTAYGAAVLCYQVGTFTGDPLSSGLWIAGIVVFASGAFCGLIVYGRRHLRRPELIPVTQVS